MTASPIRPSAGQGLPRELALLFAPLHKRAFGTAIGCASGLMVSLATAVYLLRAPDPGFNLGLLAQYFAGYTVSWTGVVVGGAWGFVSGFVAGWFVAFCRNLVIAAWLFITRTRSELAATREFLDHI